MKQELGTSPDKQDNNVLLDANDVAGMLNVSLGWVKMHTTVRRPRLPSVKLGNTPRAKRRYRRDDILQFIQDHFVRGSAA